MIDVITTLERNVTVSAFAALLFVQALYILFGILPFGTGKSSASVLYVPSPLFFMVLTIFSIVGFSEKGIVFLPFHNTLNGLHAMFGGILAHLLALNLAVFSITRLPFFASAILTLESKIVGTCKAFVEKLSCSRIPIAAFRALFLHDVTLTAKRAIRMVRQACLRSDTYKQRALLANYIDLRQLDYTTV